MAWDHEIHDLHSLLQAQAVTHKSFTRHQPLHYLVYSPLLLLTASPLLWVRPHVQWPHFAWLSCYPLQVPLTYLNDGDDHQRQNLHLVALLITALHLFLLIHCHFIVLFSLDTLQKFSSFLAHLIHFILLHALHLAVRYYQPFENFLTGS